MTLTRDGIFHDRIAVFQPASGYRFAVDSVLLGAFASSVRSERCIDLGSGCGVVGFILLFAGSVKRVVGVEVDPVLAGAAARGAQENGFGDRYVVVEADLRDAGWRPRAGRSGLVVSNPPYFEEASGPASPGEGRARARHDASLTLTDVLDAATACLEPRGRLCVVLPPARVGDLVSGAAARRMHLTRLRPVHPGPGRAARMVLVELRLEAGAGSLVLEPGLVLHDGAGAYTAEAEAILDGRPA